uniref:Calcium homeostasis endoplasmic reticulum protein n=1 Tax=Ciona intestinalis TaxID=7719 RepID=F6R9D9_CIOIN
MDIPKPPDEPEVKNIIDKLANFVARNGVEFENMTKSKQRNNPKFSFLFGGEHYGYYQYQLSTEQQIKTCAHKSFFNFRMSHHGSNNKGHHTCHTTTCLINPATLPQEEEDVEKKVKDSENNLKQQHEVLMNKQSEKIEQAVYDAQDNDRRNTARDVNISLDAMDEILQPIIDSCTKDSISAGKTWILNNGVTEEKCQELHDSTLQGKKVADASMFNIQLHIIYLINDVLHHASRKNLTHLANSLESVIVPLFCTTQSCADPDNQSRLSKLLGLWNKFKYFNKDTMHKLENYAEAVQEFKADMLDQYKDVVEKVKTLTHEQYEQYKKQHNEYEAHLRKQLQDKKNRLHDQKQQNDASLPNKPRTLSNFLFLSSKHSSNTRNNRFSERSMDDNQPPHNGQRYPEKKPLLADPPWRPREQFNDNDYNYDRRMDNDPGIFWSIASSAKIVLFTASSFKSKLIHFSPRPRNPDMEFGMRGPPPDWHGEPRRDPNWDNHPDTWGNEGKMRGPNGPWNNQGPPKPPVRPIEQDDPTLIPQAPYYDLPCGLMAPLVKLEDMEYKELDPSMIRLPPPIPPSDRLMAAVEAFYSPPSHERPRNIDGWEHNGLFEFYRAKVRANRKAKEGYTRSRSKSRNIGQDHSINWGFECITDRSRDRSYSRSRSRSYSRSRSRSSSRCIHKMSNRRSRSSSRSRSRSRSRDRERAPTPPRHVTSFGNTSFQQTNAEGRLGEDNRGAQMMKRMGWGGAGLGSSEQGIQDPVKAGDTRDKYDQFKGLGNDMNDPYENYRKNRSYGYISKIRARDEKGT